MDHASDTLGTLSRNAGGVSSRAREGDQALGAQNSSGANAAGVAVSALVLDERFWEKRDRELKAVLPLWPWQVDKHDIGSIAAMIDTLEKALRAEFERCRDGHFAASAARHTNIKFLLRQERQICKQLSDGAAQ